MNLTAGQTASCLPRSQDLAESFPPTRAFSVLCGESVAWWWIAVAIGKRGVKDRQRGFGGFSVVDWRWMGRSFARWPHVSLWR